MRDTIILVAFLAFITGCDSGKTAKADIQLSTIQCGMCKATIENGVSDLKGVVKVVVDPKKKVGHVTYNAGIIDLAAIEKAIAALGYDANSTKSDPDAYSNLSICCKIPGGH
ncbi:MAG: heavy-metal-associated domain-containing protein [Fidelibacterota bacterium]